MARDGLGVSCPLGVPEAAASEDGAESSESARRSAAALARTYHRTLRTGRREGQQCSGASTRS